MGETLGISVSHFVTAQASDKLLGNHPSFLDRQSPRQHRLRFRHLFSERCYRTPDSEAAKSLALGKNSA